MPFPYKCLKQKKPLKFFSLPMNLYRKFPPSEPCSCDICTGYCQRPGWWTPYEAQKAIGAGYGNRMMLEVSPDKTFSVLSPAFRGNEVNFAFQTYSGNGCTFLHNGLCELFGTGLQPLECRYCHHSRKGMGITCHRAIEKIWRKNSSKKIIIHWGNQTGFWKRQGILIIPK
jgi:hypothetical protein